MNQLICNTIIGQIAKTSSPSASGVATTGFFAVPIKPSHALSNSVRSLTNFTICFSIIEAHFIRSSFIEVTNYKAFPSDCYASLEPALCEKAGTVVGLYPLIGSQALGAMITSLLEIHSHPNETLPRTAQRCAIHRL